MSKLPKFIKQYLPNGDYNLIRNPEYSQARHYKPERKKVFKASRTWNRLQSLPKVKTSYNPNHCKCHDFNFEHKDKRTKQIEFDKVILNFKNEIKLLSKEDKLKRLRSIAKNKKFKSILLSYAIRRKFHDSYKSQWFKAWKICFTCNLKPVQNIHHMVQLNHGGSNNEENLIGVCKECHADIHPWLKG